MFKKLFNKKIKSTDISFQSETYSYQGEENDIHIWESSLGDGLGIYFFNKKPDLPKGKLDIDQLRSLYESQVNPINGKIVNISKETLDEVEALELLIKVPQEPSGMTYILSYTLPFEEFSFVIKAQCMEQGMTGLKETILVQKHMQDGGDLEGVEVDKEEFDSEFPDHPVARARKIAKDIKTGLSISDKVKQRKHYYPS